MTGSTRGDHMYVCRCTFGSLLDIQCCQCLSPPVRYFRRTSVANWKVGVSGDQAQAQAQNVVAPRTIAMTTSLTRGGCEMQCCTSCIEIAFETLHCEIRLPSPITHLPICRPHSFIYKDRHTLISFTRQLDLYPTSHLQLILLPCST
jgi:hypothetical protein